MSKDIGGQDKANARAWIARAQYYVDQREWGLAKNCFAQALLKLGVDPYEKEKHQ